MAHPRPVAYRPPRRHTALAGSTDSSSPQVRDEGPNQRRVTLPSGAAGWLVVSEAWDAGWRAEVDGRSAPVLRGDGGLIAVPLPAEGAREVLLRYRPRSVLLGLAISLAGLAGVLGLLWRGQMARPRLPEETP